MNQRIPFPISGGAWRYVNGELVPDVPGVTESPAEPAPAPRGKRTASNPQTAED